MRLVIGGAYQGKLAYAQKTYGIADGWIDGAACAPEEIFSCRGIYNFHEYVKRLAPAEARRGAEESPLFLEQRAEQFAEELFRRNPELVIVANELGCGIVPLERSDRLWRELTGRICTCLAARSAEVVRVVCGIGVRLK